MIYDEKWEISWKSNKSISLNKLWHIPMPLFNFPYPKSILEYGHEPVSFCEKKGNLM